ncbi:unnamed protein product [Mytilus edulis]|uniref:Uncharacterized protein n=1 Tax=Mytilus edulis TaxID=6550 RepID=A0A8S3PLM1_MYTED|nr:unnamed protein product [Mytilus edulis]
MSEKVCTDNRLSLYIAENKFRKACEQIKLITRRLNLLQIRYDKAKRDDMKSFRYTLWLQLATTEGARNMFYEYAVKQATQVSRLKREIKTQQLPKVEQFIRNHQYQKKLAVKWGVANEESEDEKADDKLMSSKTAFAEEGSFSEPNTFSKESEIVIRYDKAKRDDMKSFRYTLRLQLATTEGARNMFYEYAVKQATQVGCLKREIKDTATAQS